MKIVADIAIPYLPGVFEPFAEVVYRHGASISAGDVRDADTLIVRTRTRCDVSLLDGSAVKLIATATIGSDHIDLDYCRRKGIGVATAAGCNARGVLQWVGAVLAGASHRMGFTPEGKVLGVVGVGNTGRLVAEYGALWGFEVVCCDPPRVRAERLRDFVTLDELARRSDVVSFHVPLICSGEYATSGMAGKRFFELLRPGALLLNSSRGEALDEFELLGAMDRGVEAAIDTWCGEPDINRELLDRAVFTTPHIAGYSLQGKANATTMAVRAVARLFDIPLTEWSAPVEPSVPRRIAWPDMRATMPSYFDIEAQSRSLKENPGQFEEMRNSYDYRLEYF